MSSTDAFTTCSQGHEHWGTASAAGILIYRLSALGKLEVLLQLRGPLVHLPHTWSIPGGALEHGESATEGALRETREELGIRPKDLKLGQLSVDDHGGWSYTTVLATPTRELDPSSLKLNDESLEVRFVALDEMDSIKLHPGFATSLPTLRALLPSSGTQK
ncbi:hypothetical protein F4779DRAFT_502708 [Xylariaceae sp. FL0662B]|nr:hypothetical protein F4779DRAFT_502708 [Xylariaceae sp. FL0662B]